MKEGGRKLSKREGDASFEDFYEKGYLPEAIINYIALLGWSPGTEQEFFTLDELIEQFDIKGLSKSPAVFDVNKLRWMNGEYIRRMSVEEFHKLALPYYEKYISSPDVDLNLLSKLLHTRVDVLEDIKLSLIHIFFQGIVYRAGRLSGRILHEVFPLYIQFPGKWHHSGSD